MIPCPQIHLSSLMLPEYQQLFHFHRISNHDNDIFGFSFTYPDISSIDGSLQCRHGLMDPWFCSIKNFKLRLNKPFHLEQSTVEQ